MMQEKIDVIHLHDTLPSELHLDLVNVENLETIGSGSFGKIYKGRYQDRNVAMKRYRANLLMGKSDVEMLCREVSVLGSLDSLYIVKFIGACLQDPSVSVNFLSYFLYSCLHKKSVRSYSSSSNSPS